MRAKAKCPDCSRVLPVQPPRGGDGSMDVFPRHSVTGKKYSTARVLRCPRSRQEVWTMDYVMNKFGDPVNQEKERR